MKAETQKPEVTRIAAVPSGPARTGIGSDEIADGALAGRGRRTRRRSLGLGRATVLADEVGDGLRALRRGRLGGALRRGRRSGGACGRAAAVAAGPPRFSLARSASEASPVTASRASVSKRRMAASVFGPVTPSTAPS